MRATTAFYNSIRAELLPTSSKCHYTYNLRDVARVRRHNAVSGARVRLGPGRGWGQGVGVKLQRCHHDSRLLAAWRRNGLTVAPLRALQVVQGLMRASPKDTTDQAHLVTLWLHESSRVFADRLTCDEDARWFRAAQERQLAEELGTSWAEVVGGDRLLYGDYLNPGSENKVRRGELRTPAVPGCCHATAMHQLPPGRVAPGCSGWGSPWRPAATDQAPLPKTGLLAGARPQGPGAADGVLPGGLQRRRGGADAAGGLPRCGRARLEAVQVMSV